MGCDTERSLVDPPSPSVRQPWPRKRMCPTGTDTLWPRPAPSPKEERLLKFLESSALLTRAGAATWPNLAGASHRSVLPAAQSRDSQPVPAPLNGRPHAPRLHSDGLFSGRTRTAPWRLLRVALWKRSHGQAESWWHSVAAAELAGQGPRPGCGGRRRPRGGPGPGACGASAELAGRAGARAAAPPPGAGKGGCAELLRARIRLTRL